MHKILKSGSFLFFCFLHLHLALFHLYNVHFSVAGGPNGIVLNCGSFIMLHFLHSVVL